MFGITYLLGYNYVLPSIFQYGVVLQNWSEKDFGLFYNGLCWFDIQFVDDLNFSDPCCLLCSFTVDHLDVAFYMENYATWEANIHRL